MPHVQRFETTLCIFIRWATDAAPFAEHIPNNFLHNFASLRKEIILSKEGKEEKREKRKKGKRGKRGKTTSRGAVFTKV